MLEDSSQQFQPVEESYSTSLRASLGQQYDPLSPAHIANPYAFYARARKEEPIFFSPILNAWVVTRYEDVVAILKDQQHFAANTRHAGDPLLTPEAHNLLRSSQLWHVPTLNSAEPPVSSRLRGAVAKVFSPQHIVGLQPQIRACTNQLIDHFAAFGQVDFVEHFASPYPMMVMADILKVPESDRKQLRRWSDNLATLMLAPPPPEQQLTCVQQVVTMFSYIQDLAEERRRAPQEDLISDVYRAVEAGQAALSPLEVASLLVQLWQGGIETTSRFLGTCLLHLLTHQSHWKAIVQDPGSIQQIVEEALRFDGPSLSIWRIAKEDVVINGKHIPKEARVQVLQSSANHDEEFFEHPDTFDPSREGLRHHLAFGHGIHSCLGFALARLEVRMALEQLSQRLPSLRLVPDQPLRYTPSLIFHGLQQLLVQWDLAD